MVAAAVAFGFAAAQARLPPFVGYLAAGFALHALGFESTPVIEETADVGLLLLLFGIGSKLRLRTRGQPTVWGTALIAALATVAVVAGLLIALGGTTLPLIGGMGAGQALLVGFALSFSSTVFAVKTLEEQGEQASLAGRVAIGVLIVQDLFAVAFLTASEGALPSAWAVALSRASRCCGRSPVGCSIAPVMANCSCCSGSRSRSWWAAAGSRSSG